MNNELMTVVDAHAEMVSLVSDLKHWVGRLPRRQRATGIEARVALLEVAIGDVLTPLEKDIERLSLEQEEEDERKSIESY